MHHHTVGPTPATDADRRTLHIRCGHDIREALAAAGFHGDFLAFTDPYCQGPLRPGRDFLAQRADFIATQYGGTPPRVLEGLREEHDRLLAVAESHERAVLWFEHDSYDQLVLARVLGVLEQHPPALLELICIDRFDGVEPFRGLGQLSPAQLRSLWPGRRTVTPEHFALARRAWQALGDSSPLAVHALAAAGTPAVPAMAGALRRHLEELPHVGSGLGLTQALCLAVLADGPLTAGRVFGDVTRFREPLPFLGDAMFWPFLEALCRGDRPLLLRRQDARDIVPHERLYEITDAGRAALLGELDWMSTSPDPRWVGGVYLDGAACWRWDPRTSAPVAP